MHQAVTETVLTSLVNDMDRLNQEIVLVLDDFQYISNQDVLSAIAFLLDHCPRTFHLLIATRSDPLLPLSRLRARGQLVELRAADLRFSGDEAIRFLNDVMGLQLEQRAVAILEERTEGWVAGLQMAALSMREREDVRGFIAGFSGTNRHILDFLLEEIMASQSPEMQHFLLNTSILDRLTAPLCDAILADDEVTEPFRKDDSSTSDSSNPGKSDAALRYLERENLFLISLDDKRTWFRYHHLFTDLLRAKLHQMNPGVIPHLHIRASDWLEKNGFITEAIQHLLDVQEYGHAADLIERYGPGRLAESDPSVFQMAEGLPREILITRPKIGLYQAWLQIIQGHIIEAIPLLKGMAQQLEVSEHTGKQQWMQTVISTALVFLAPPSGSPADNPLPNELLLDDIPENEMILRNAADFLYGMALARKGQLEHAIDISMKCIERERSQQGEIVIPTLASFVTRIHLITGRLNTCANLCHEYLDPIKERGIRFVYTSGSMKIDLGEVMYEWNRLEEAEEYTREGLLGNEPWQNIMTDGFGLTSLTRVLLAKGDYSGAMQTVEQMEATLRSRAVPREFEEDFHTLRVRVQLASGDLKSAGAWADQIQRSMDYEANKWRYPLTLARIALARHRYEDVVKILTEMKPMISCRSRTSRQIESKLLQAEALHGMQRQSEAIALLDSALMLAEAEGYLRVFLNGGKAVLALVTEYLKSGKADHRLFARAVLNAFAPTQNGGAGKSPAAGLIEPLSDRELEVLQLIAQGQTNEEIARHLIVARGTIKAHAASIYRKLDVANRTEAVTRARQLGLLD